ncbi:hypothetical protein IAR55_005610 [Kwoniella newhampshirensis]|uniref:3-hydroxybutyryl-CoA dehydrogenase n=1 Tax=Kwoniella newhampshirensis TaxID=1651941 RepID=A0AAW0YJB0_9TREE
MSSLAPIRKVAIVGAGQMGLGIAYVSAVHARVHVAIHDPSSSVLSSAMELYRSLLSRDVAKSRITQSDEDAALSRVKSVVGDGSGQSGETIKDDVDVVIEAIPEIPDLKLGLFKKLGGLLPSSTILASNTSSISITKLAAAAGNGASSEERKASASRVIGIHYFNPVPQMKLVEIIPALQTSQETIERAKAFGRACKKEVTTSTDSPGFIANAILMPMINEAIMVLEKGIASAEDIDTTFRLGMAHPMGPLALADLIGLDTCLNIQKVLHNETGDSKYRPSGLLSRMVDAGWVGRKAGKGFYEYDAKGGRLTIPPSRALVQQRDYRARKAEKIAQLQQTVEELREENAALKAELVDMKNRENARLKGEQSADIAVDSRVNDASGSNFSHIPQPGTSQLDSDRLNTPLSNPPFISPLPGTTFPPIDPGDTNCCGGLFDCSSSTVTGLGANSISNPQIKADTVDPYINIQHRHVQDTVERSVGHPVDDPPPFQLDPTKCCYGLVDCDLVAE